MVQQLIVFVLLVVVAGIYIIGMRRDSNKLTALAANLFAVYAIAWILFMVYAWINHINFPLNLEAMELTVVQHLKRIMAGQPVYVEPSPDFVPLAYAPLYYYFSVPFAWLFGANLLTMRLVSILGMLGSGIVIYLAVRRHTQSHWWGIIAVGLFASAYRVMDAYLDNAHSDSWLLCTVFLGCYLIEQNRSRAYNLIGVFFLIVSFWFKQHGALFVIGGVLYLTWRDGLKNSWIYWALAALLGPALYIVAPSLMFGPQFHYYTYSIPSHWSELTFGAVKRYIGFAVKGYLALAGIGVLASLYFLIRKLSKVSVWYFILPFAMLSGFMGALDPGSNNNVFITMGVWFILTGVLGLHYLTEHFTPVNKWAMHLGVLALSFGLFFYNPKTVLVSPKAPEAYQDFIGYLNSLDGSVYAPWLGQLQDGYAFSPSVHWVPMEDLIRGPGVDERNHPTTRKLLDAAIHPNGTAYILMNYPLENDPLLGFLLDDYHLETDLGDRFASLGTLPRRFDLQYPRYLYKYGP
ncbi:MAG: glycosyltransferase family 39 protein [Anaerolineales bacterium]|nr:glycosyltransferase family 39 protein [Anaerolineales bacterium]